MPSLYPVYISLSADENTDTVEFEAKKTDVYLQETVTIPDVATLSRVTDGFQEWFTIYRDYYPYDSYEQEHTHLGSALTQFRNLLDNNLPPTLH